MASQRQQEVGTCLGRQDPNEDPLGEYAAFNHLRQRQECPALGHPP